MRKILLTVVSALSVIGAFAQTEPVITLTADVDGNTRELEVALSAEGTVQVDWGDGNLETSGTIAAYDGWETTKLSGTVKGEGTVKVYGDNIIYFSCISRVDGAQVSTLDVTNATALQELYANGNKLMSIDLTKNAELTKVDLQNNLLENIDLSKNTNLTKLTLSNNLLSSIDIANCQSLQTLYLSDNLFAGTLDLSTNPGLKSVYCLNNALTSVNMGNNTASKPYFSFNNNMLTSFDASGISDIANGTLFLVGNQLTEFTVPEKGIKTLNLSNNKFTLATLPRYSSSRFTYAPQADLTVEENYGVNDEIDLSAQTDDNLATVYALVKGDGTALEENTDYTVADGKVKLLTAQESAYVTMTSAFYPKFTGTNVYKTTTFKVDVADGIRDINATDGNATIYSIDGTLISGSHGIPAGKGVYVVKTNGKTYKVAK